MLLGISPELIFGRKLIVFVQIKRVNESITIQAVKCVYMHILMYRLLKPKAKTASRSRRGSFLEYASTLGGGNIWGGT